MLPELHKLLQYTNPKLLTRYHEDYPENTLCPEDALQELLKFFWLSKKHRLALQQSPINETLLFNCGIHDEMKEIDDMWHTFLLFTQEYQNFCQQYFGEFIHHLPEEHENVPQQNLEADLNRYLTYIYDELGQETLKSWFQEYFIEDNDDNLPATAAISSLAIRMEKMIWVDVEDTIKKSPFLLIPLGAKQKEHGLHLPLNTDFILAEYFCDKVLERYNILAASTVDINFYPAFTEYPGSEHLTFETACDLIYQKCQSHIKHGIKSIYILNMGISTIAVLENVQKRLRQEKIYFNYTDLRLVDENPIIQDLQEQLSGTHADEIETSMMLYIKPEVVNMKKAVKADDIIMKKPGGLTRSPNADHGLYSPSGAWGNPLLASKHKGEIIVKEYLNFIFRDIDHMLNRN